MAFDIEAAKADGYTDEEIQEYLAKQKHEAANPNAPVVPPQESVDNTRSNLATAALGAGGAAAVYGAKNALVNMGKNAVKSLMPGQGPIQPPSAPVQAAPAPVAPANVPAPTPAAPVNLSPEAQAIARPAAAAESSAPGLMEHASNLYRMYGPAALEMMSKVAKGAGVGALLTHSRGLNEGEDEALAKMQTRLNQIGQGGNTPNALTSGFSQQLNTLNKKRTEQ